jgi:hypothetical protein
MLYWRDLVQSGRANQHFADESTAVGQLHRGLLKYRDTLAGRAFLDQFIHWLGAPHPRSGSRTQLYQSVLDAAVARHSRSEVKDLIASLPCNS